VFAHRVRGRSTGLRALTFARVASLNAAWLSGSAMPTVAFYARHIRAVPARAAAPACTALPATCAAPRTVFRASPMHDRDAARLSARAQDGTMDGRTAGRQRERSAVLAGSKRRITRCAGLAAAAQYYATTLRKHPTFPFHTFCLPASLTASSGRSPFLPPHTGAGRSWCVDPLWCGR
jgi:hypothetical protein